MAGTAKTGKWGDSSIPHGFRGDGDGFGEGFDNISDFNTQEDGKRPEFTDFRYQRGQQRQRRPRRGYGFKGRQHSNRSTNTNTNTNELDDTEIQQERQEPAKDTNNKEPQGNNTERGTNFNNTYSEITSMNLDIEHFHGDKTVSANIPHFITNVSDLQFAIDLGKMNLWDKVTGMQFSTNKRICEISFAQKEACDKIVANGLQTHGTTLDFVYDKPPTINVSVINTPLQMNINNIAGDMQQYGPIVDYFDIYKTLNNKKYANGTRVFCYERLTRPIPKQINIGGRRCQVIYTGQNEHLRAAAEIRNQAQVESDADANVTTEVETPETVDNAAVENSTKPGNESTAEAISAPADIQNSNEDDKPVEERKTQEVTRESENRKDSAEHNEEVSDPTMDAETSENNRKRSKERSVSDNEGVITKKNIIPKKGGKDNDDTETGRELKETMRLLTELLDQHGSKWDVKVLRAVTTSLTESEDTVRLFYKQISELHDTELNFIIAWYYHAAFDEFDISKEKIIPGLGTEVKEIWNTFEQKADIIHERMKHFLQVSESIITTKFKYNFL